MEKEIKKTRKIKKPNKSMKHFGFIYKWTDSSNGSTYTGSHKGSPDDGYTGSGTKFLHAYKKRKEKFTREILEIVPGNKEKLLEVEQKYLDQINWDNTYNLARVSGGGNLTANLTQEKRDEWKRKISESSKGIKKPQPPWSEERRKNHKAHWAGKHLSEETKEKIRKGNIGKHTGNKGALGHRWNHTKEALQKMSEFQKGRPKSKEHREKISRAMMGNTCGSGGLGYKKSEETKQKMRVSQQARRKKNK